MPYLNAFVDTSAIVSALDNAEDFADFINEFGCSRQKQDWFRDVVDALEIKGEEFVETLAAAIKVRKESK